MFSIIPVRFGAEPKGSSTSCAQLALYKHWMMVGTGGRPLPTSLPHSSSTLLTHCLPENLISRLFSAFAKLRQHLLQEVFPEQLSLVSLQPTNSIFSCFPYNSAWEIMWFSHGQSLCLVQSYAAGLSVSRAPMVRGKQVWAGVALGLGFEGWMSGKGLGGFSDRVGEGL